MSAKAILAATAAAASLLATAAHAQIFEGDAIMVSDRTAAQQPALMVVGSVHLANNNRDVINLKVEGIHSPAKQAEIEEAVRRLAQWAPTRIAVEIKHADQAKLDRIYADYRAGIYELTANEIDQFGLRLAAMLGHDRVYAVDWNDMPPGEVASYDWTKPANPPASYDTRFAAITSPERAKAGQAMADTLPMREWLAALNTPAHLDTLNKPYFELALLGHEGANWVGTWYARNLKIFGNIVDVANSPQERVLVIYGVGHAYLLNRFAADSGAFQVQDASEWLNISADQPN